MSDPGQESRVGSQIGPYRLRRLLGKGGMGEVYEAEDTVKDRIVALKLLPESASSDPVFRKRLQREAHAAGRLQEPHVVPIHDYGEIDGFLFVDMRMIEGNDLRKVLKGYGPMTPARSVAIVKQIASALDAAHEAGITHRDVKPENIILNREDFAYLVDFGIANAVTDEKLTQLGTAVGTYAYMAPERFTNDDVTYRADVYALACVLHECLTGSQPFSGDSVGTIITAHLMNPVPRPSVQRPGIPAKFDPVIARGMAKKPDDRYASAGDLATAATDALTHREQDQAATILQRSEAATRPAMMPPPPPPSQPRLQTPPPTPPPYPVSHTAPPPPSGPRPVAFHTPPPPSSGPPSGPMWSTSPQPPGPPQKPPSGGTKVPWIPLAAAAAVFVLVVGTLGIWLMVRQDDDRSAPTSTQVTPGPTSTTTETTTDDRPPNGGRPRTRTRSTRSSSPCCRAVTMTAFASRCTLRRRAHWRLSTAVLRHRKADRRTPGTPCSPTRRPSTRPSMTLSRRTPNSCNARTAESIRRRRGISPRPRTRSRAASPAASTTATRTWRGPSTRTCCSATPRAPTSWTCTIGG